LIFNDVSNFFGYWSSDANQKMRSVNGQRWRWLDVKLITEVTQQGK